MGNEPAITAATMDAMKRTGDLVMAGSPQAKMLARTVTAGRVVARGIYDHPVWHRGTKTGGKPPVRGRKADGSDAPIGQSDRGGQTVAVRSGIRRMASIRIPISSQPMMAIS